jgi:hypothetical protein
MVSFYEEVQNDLIGLSTHMNRLAHFLQEVLVKKLTIPLTRPHKI